MEYNVSNADRLGDLPGLSAYFFKSFTTAQTGDSRYLETEEIHRKLAKTNNSGLQK